MRDICSLLWCALSGLFRSRASLQAEVLTLRQQLNVLQRKAPARPVFRSVDRLILSVLYRVAPSVLDALTIVRPETMIRWHRAGFRAWWRWKSRPPGGRPKTPLEIRRLIRDVSLANPLWGAPLCVPRTSSVLISRRNRLTSAHYDRAAMFGTGRLDRAIQVEEPA